MRIAVCFCRNQLDFEGFLKAARSPFPKVLKGWPSVNVARLHL